MLSVPTSGFGRSINTHNINLDSFCDWIEASVLFSKYSMLSTTDVVDVLIEGAIYDSQDYAREMIDNAWRELSRRQNWMGRSSTINVSGQRIERLREWRDNPAHSFLVTLSLAKLYPSWARQFGSNYTEQGELFENLTKQSLQNLFPEWGVFITGWSRARTNQLAKVVEEVASSVCEPIGEITRWTKPSAHEAGLDVVCHYKFQDGKAGAPVYLLQCASGTEWESKLHTPDIRLWKRIISFTCDPQKAFALPFALTDSEFTRVCNLVNGMILDRYRLLSPGAVNSNWIPSSLNAQLVKWLRGRVRQLIWA